MSNQKKSKSKISQKSNSVKNFNNYHSHMWKTYASNVSTGSINSYPYKWEDKSFEPENIDLGFEGWTFSLTHNVAQTKIEGIKHFEASGISIVIAASILDSSKNDWYKVFVSLNTATPNDSNIINQDENNIDIKVSIKSNDDDYKNWFKNWSINQDGMCLSFSSKDNMSVIEEMSIIGNIIEKIKGRLILEKLSQNKS